MAGARPAAPERRRFTLSDRQVGILFMLPFIVTAALFMVWPVVEAVRMAFYAYNPLRPDDIYWVGLENFERIFDDPLFWDSFRQALIWTGWSILFQTVLGVALALLLNLTLPGMAIYRGLLLFPYIVPTVVIALNWRWIFNSEIGIVNHALLSMGLISENIAWLSTPDMAMLSAILLNVWKYTPFVVICVLARLQTIPTELYDAAKVDGAGAWRRFMDITLPMLKEVLVVVIVFRTIWTFNKFEEIYLLTRGGPGTSTFNLAVYAFEEGMANLRLGVAAATGVVMIGLLLVGTILYVRVSGFGREEKTA
ncbi:carbohydrate ABC transporter permease [Sediminicoccus sp. BL-A-41-H5]|uniref:carbohydrate ABC transporter permease n=1 Tax=Sediminicoccus sp. BL-A-41-H5 TaxID=3421106 RepID=UPI003D664A14